MKKSILFLTMFVLPVYADNEKYGNAMKLVRGVVDGQVEEGFFNEAFDTEYQSVFAALVHHCVGGRFLPKTIEAFVANKRDFLEDHEQAGVLYRCLCEEAARQIGSREFRMLIKNTVLTP